MKEELKEDLLCKTNVYKITSLKDDVEYYKEEDENQDYLEDDYFKLAEKEYLEDLKMRCKYYQDFLIEEGWEE